MYIDPKKLLQQKESVVGTVKLSELTRLSDLVADMNAEFGNHELSNFDNIVTYKVACVLDNNYDYSKDYSKIAGTPKFCLLGNIAVDLHISCNRCSMPMLHTLSVDFSICLDEQEANIQKLAGQHQQHVDLYALLEDELILHMPLFPKHSLNQQNEVDVDVKQCINLVKDAGVVATVNNKPFYELGNLLKVH